MIVAMGCGLFAGCDAAPSPWDAAMVSVNAAGTDGGNGWSWFPVFSPDGTKVLFRSDASDLGFADTNEVEDVFLRDLVTGTTTLITVNADGTATGNSSILDLPAFSPDGTKVAFVSFASDLVANDTNGVTDVFLRDLVTQTTSLVSANAAGTDSGNDESLGMVFSPDGTKLEFVSDASDLGPTDSNGGRDVYLRDLVAGTTSLVSVNASGSDAGNLPAGGVGGFSPDGTALFFETPASDHGPVDSNGTSDIYRRDLVAGATSLVSSNAAGTDAANAGSTSVQVSPDGTAVTFASQATDLGPSDDTTTFDIYWRDLATGTTELVTVNGSGTGGGNDNSFGAGYFSPDGTKIAFESYATNLGETDTNGWSDIYLRDLTTDATSLISDNAEGTNSSNGLSWRPVFSPDGTKLAFQTTGDNLGPLDTNEQNNSFLREDAYIHDLVTGTVHLLSARADGRDSGNGGGSFPVFSPNGSQVAINSWSDNLGPPDHNGQLDLYLLTLEGADLSVEATASPGPVPSGGEIVYTLELSSRGPETAGATTAGLLLSEGTSFVSVTTSAGSCAPPTPEEPLVVACSFASVLPGPLAEVVVTATVTAPVGSTLTALAAIDAELSTDPDNANDVVSITTAVS